MSLSRLKFLRNLGVGPLKEKDRRTEAEKDRRTEAGEPEHARVPEGTVADTSREFRFSKKLRQSLEHPCVLP